MAGRASIAAVVVTCAAISRPAAADTTAKTTTATAAADDAADSDDASPAVHERAPEPLRPHNEFYFRAGMAYVAPRISTSNLRFAPSPLLSIAAPPNLQGGFTASNADVVTAIIGFAPAALGGHIAFETVVGVPWPTSTSKFGVTGPLATQSLAPSEFGIATGIPALGSQLGQGLAAPIMLTAIYRLPVFGPVTAYAGAGGAVLFVVDAEVTNPVVTKVATPELSISPMVGVIAQGGLDIHIYDNIYARLDVREMWLDTADETVSNIQVHTTIPNLETVNVGTVKADVSANPIIIQAGVGATF